MGAKATKKLSTSLADVDAVWITAIAMNDNGAPYGGRPTFCPSGVLNTGDSPSFFYVSNPVNTFGDEAAPAVALKSSGVAGKIKPGSRMEVKMRFSSGKAETIMCGTLVQYTHVFGYNGQHEDSALDLIFDDKWLLTKVTCHGKATYDPRTGKYWLDASPLIFDKLGYPDCIDTPYGPRFAPEYRFGYGSTDFDEPAVGDATAKARSWRAADIVKYIRDMYYSNGDGAPKVSEGYGRNVVSHWVGWSERLENAIGGDRTVKHFDLENDTVLTALSKTLRKAGPYDLICEPAGRGRSKLGIANMGPSNTAAGSGSILMLPDYDTSLDVGGLLNTSNCIHSGYMNESIVNYFHRTTNLGDTVVVERFLSTKTTRSGGDASTPLESLSGLEPAWDRGVNAAGVPIPIGTDPAAGSDEWKGLRYISNVDGDGDPEPNTKGAFFRMLQRWPNVFSRYRVKAGYDLWFGTKYAGIFNRDSYPRIHPHLLSGTNIGGAQTSPENFVFKEIVVECELDRLNGYWLQAFKEDNFKLDPEGRTFTIDALRSNSNIQTPLTWYTTVGSGTYQAYSGSTIVMKPNHIRATIAIESDWRISGVDETDPNRMGGRVAGEKFNHVTVAKELRYVEWQRRRSKPDGGYSEDGIQMAPADPGLYPDKCTVGGELFSDIYSGRVQRQAAIRQRDVRRIEYTGQLVMQNMTCGIRPGDPVSVEGRNTIPTFSVVRTVTFDCNDQDMKIDLANADLRKIYDIPQSQLMGSPSGSGPSGSSGPSSDQTGQSGGNYPNTGGYGDYDSEKGASGGREARTTNMPAQGGEGGAAGSAGGAGGRRKGQILSGDALARKDAANAAMGDPERGIFTPDQSKRGDDELKARHYGNDANRTRSDISDNNGGIAAERRTPTEDRRRKKANE